MKRVVLCDDNGKLCSFIKMLTAKVLWIIKQL